MDMIDDVIRYESGEMSAGETIEFFSVLVKSGLAWQLQGYYGRNAINLISAGFLNELGELTETGRIAVDQMS